MSSNAMDKFGIYAQTSSVYSDDEKDIASFYQGGRVCHDAVLHYRTLKDFRSEFDTLALDMVVNPLREQQYLDTKHITSYKAYMAKTGKTALYDAIVDTNGVPAIHELMKTFANEELQTIDNQRKNLLDTIEHSNYTAALDEPEIYNLNSSAGKVLIKKREFDSVYSEYQKLRSENPTAHKSLKRLLTKMSQISHESYDLLGTLVTINSEDTSKNEEKRLKEKQMLSTLREAQKDLQVLTRKEIAIQTRLESFQEYKSVAARLEKTGFKEGPNLGYGIVYVVYDATMPPNIFKEELNAGTCSGLYYVCFDHHRGTSGSDAVSSQIVSSDALFHRFVEETYHGKLDRSQIASLHNTPISIHNRADFARLCRDMDLYVLSTRIMPISNAVLTDDILREIKNSMKALANVVDYLSSEEKTLLAYECKNLKQLIQFIAAATPEQKPEADAKEISVKTLIEKIHKHCFPKLLTLQTRPFRPYEWEDIKNAISALDNIVSEEMTPLNLNNASQQIELAMNHVFKYTRASDINKIPVSTIHALYRKYGEHFAANVRFTETHIFAGGFETLARSMGTEYLTNEAISLLSKVQEEAYNQLSQQGEAEMNPAEKSEALAMSL